MGDIVPRILSDIVDLHKMRLGTLVPEEPYSISNATRYQVYRGLAHVFFC